MTIEVYYPSSNKTVSKTVKLVKWTVNGMAYTVARDMQNKLYMRDERGVWRRR